MLTAVVQPSAIDAIVHLVTADEGSESTAEVKQGPSPIVPEVKELAWGAGSFVVFAVLMRFVLFPRLKRGMDARYNGIRADHDQAAAVRAQALAEVADYEAQLATVKAEAAKVVDAAREKVETERQARIAELNARLSERRAATLAETEAARAAAHGDIRAAVVAVAGRAGEIATGRAVSSDVVDRVVGEVMAR